MLRPKAKAPQGLQSGEIVGTKVEDKWVKFKLLDADRTQNKDSSYLWRMVGYDGDVITRDLTPQDKWGVLRGVDDLLDLEELDTNVSETAKQVYARPVQQQEGQGEGEGG